MALDRSKLREIAADMQKALELVLKRHGVEVEIGGARFTDVEATYKVRIFSGSKDNAKQVEWNKYCVLFGMRPEDFGKTFTSNGETYTIDGLNLKAKRMPILATRSDGSGFKFDSVRVKFYMGKA